jgi:SAM-dependent methyltransferase
MGPSNTIIIDKLKEVFVEGRSIKLLDKGIYTALDGKSLHHQYDRKAAIYDFLVSSQLYNRLVWGDSPHNYAAFASQAVKSHQGGLVLDAGCGSLLFTARAHLECDRLVIACDQSIDMLRRAQKRLLKLGGGGCGRIILLQADISDFPFHASSFQTILCMNVLHHYSDAAGMIRHLKASLADNGQLYLTSLVRNDRLIGDRYLNFLYKNGWIVRPRSSAELKSLSQDLLGAFPGYKTRGNMAYVTAANLPVE